MCSPRKSDEIFSIFTFYESKQMSLTRLELIARRKYCTIQLQRQKDLLLCTINCFLLRDRLQNMAVGNLAFYYTLYLWNDPHFNKYVIKFKGHLHPSQQVITQQGRGQVSKRSLTLIWVASLQTKVKGLFKNLRYIKYCVEVISWKPDWCHFIFW